ncbi:AraC family transcriptional regulator [Marinococcus halophilus]|uniref:Putative HTH-type transcriptional regulator YdeE n=1 Tax=Marinococcus halophilus TaxID=1371 RepID=A0A510Y3U0_MARHA|nr:AraC family transcriptional regulator [Marinococcus halophilus]OZT80906.1 AraC family transcriptional regulator [Marinococcus halophilus]GEK57964.1 putative HTH-type transcriptional regulator YdeE [Marinococcus halophilus]
MDNLREMNNALQYIENHLTEAIDLQKAALIASCSEYHFKRMFSSLAGVPISEYIRRRRLTMAALDLQNRQVRIIDTALKYGYDSPDSFTRAFQKLHGIAPSKVKEQGISLKAYPKLTFQLSVQGGNEMNYRIEKKEAFRIVGISKRVPIIFEGENPEINAMWQSLSEEKIHELLALSNGEPGGMIQASTNFSEARMEEQGELDHYIGVVTDKTISEAWEALEVPASTWAVFTSSGPFPEHLQTTWGQIYSEWFPSSGYQQAQGPEILWMENNQFHNPDFTSEIWIPVKS